MPLVAEVDHRQGSDDPDLKRVGCPDVEDPFQPTARDGRGDLVMTSETVRGSHGAQIPR